MPRHRSRRRRRRSSNSGAGLVLAVVALVGVMGVTVFKDRLTADRKRPVAQAKATAPKPVYVPPARSEPAPRVLSAWERMEKSIRDVEREMPSLRLATRGEGFESLRVDLLSRAADTRDEVGAFLDKHPSDSRANRLWDRVLRAYVALKKL